MIRPLFICLLFFACAIFSQEDYVIIVNKNVRDSAFREETIPVTQGGFSEYFVAEAENGKKRTYYRITDEGRKYYQEKCEEWQLTKEVIENFISA